MAEHQEEICLRLEVLNAQHQPLGGTVDIAGMPEEGASPFLIHAANASENINVRGPARDPNHPYEVTVTPTGTSESVTQLVTVPSEGFPTVQFVFEQVGATASIAPDPPQSAATEVAAVVAPISVAAPIQHPLPWVPPYTLTGFLVFDHGLPASQDRHAPL